MGFVDGIMVEGIEAIRSLVVFGWGQGVRHRDLEVAKLGVHLFVTHVYLFRE